MPACYSKQNKSYLDFQEGLVRFATSVNGLALMPTQPLSMKETKNLDICYQKIIA
jgi:hypothetical protein